MDLAELGKPIFSFETKELGTLQVNPIYTLSLSERLSLVDPITYPNDNIIRKLISLLCIKTDDHKGYLKRGEAKKISYDEVDYFSKRFSQKGIPRNIEIPQTKPEEQSNIDFLCIQLIAYVGIEKEKHQESVKQFTSSLSFSNSTTENINKLMAGTTTLNHQDILDGFKTQDRLADLSEWANSNNSVEWTKLHLEDDHDTTQQSFFNPTEPLGFELPNPIEDTNKSLERVEKSLGSMNSFAQEAAIVQVQIANELKKSGDENSKLGNKNFWISFAVLIMTSISLVMTFISLLVAHESIQESSKAAQEFSSILKHVDKNIEQTSQATLAMSTSDTKIKLVLEKLLLTIESQPKTKEQQILINELREEAAKNKKQVKKLKDNVEQLKTKLQKSATPN